MIVVKKSRSHTQTASPVNLIHSFKKITTKSKKINDTFVCAENRFFFYFANSGCGHGTEFTTLGQPGKFSST